MKIITLSFVFLSGLGYGQSGMIVSGTSVSNGSGSLSYSVGQIDFQPAYGSGGSVTPGNQQPFEIFENPTSGLTENELNISVFPNPVQQLLTIQSEGIAEKNLHYRMIDTEGRVISKGLVQDGKNTLNVADFQSGTYFLEISRGEKLIKSFKLIKNI